MGHRLAAASPNTRSRKEWTFCKYWLRPTGCALRGSGCSSPRASPHGNRHIIFVAHSKRDSARMTTMFEKFLLLPPLARRAVIAAVLFGVMLVDLLLPKCDFT